MPLVLYFPLKTSEWQVWMSICAQDRSCPPGRSGIGAGRRRAGGRIVVIERGDMVLYEVSGRERESGTGAFDVDRIVVRDWGPW